MERSVPLEIGVSGFNGTGEETPLKYVVQQRDATSQKVIFGLQRLYRAPTHSLEIPFVPGVREKLRPLEETFMFGQLHYDAITDTDLAAKSHVLIIGQYSTGKTTFVRHLLGADFPNMNIGPEPTTDKFTVVMHGEENVALEGNSLTVIKELPYAGLTKFGTGFLNKLVGTVCTSPFLENITLVDTPGVLSGQMQSQNRSYNFAEVARWFGDRSDMILLLFDAHKLDVSDELMEILARLVDYQDKVRIVLNKADQIDRAKLMRVYGSLMWSMGKVFNNPEVVRVYVGSFWDQELKHNAHHRLFEADQDSLTQELVNLPRLSAIRKINGVIKRTKMVKTEACILSYLREEMPRFGKAAKRQEMLDNLGEILQLVKEMYGLHDADMPDPDALRIKLSHADFMTFPKLGPNSLRQLDDILTVEIPKVVDEGGGSENVFKFSGLTVPGTEEVTASGPRRGLFSRAGTSMRDIGVSLLGRPQTTTNRSVGSLGLDEGNRGLRLGGKAFRHHISWDGAKGRSQGQGTNHKNGNMKMNIWKMLWSILVMALVSGIVIVGLVPAINHAQVLQFPWGTSHPQGMESERGDYSPEDIAGINNYNQYTAAPGSSANSGVLAKAFSNARESNSDLASTEDASHDEFVVSTADRGGNNYSPQNEKDAPLVETETDKQTVDTR